MTRDWVLTLLALSSPLLLAATIIALASIRRPTQNEQGPVGRTRLGHAAERARWRMGAQRLPSAPHDTATEHEVHDG